MGSITTLTCMASFTNHQTHLYEAPESCSFSTSKRGERRGSWKGGTVPEPGIYFDRTAGRHCHHRHFGGHAPARAGQGQGRSKKGQLSQQPQTNWTCQQDVRG